MSDIRESLSESLLEKMQELLCDLLGASASSEGDLAMVESALNVALDKARHLMVASALRVAEDALDHAWSCRACGRALTGWSSAQRTVVTAFGEGSVRVRRYRCRTCGTDARPFLILNGLEKTIYTVGARQVIAEEASQTSFGGSSARLQRLGICISAAEVERVADEVSEWRTQEEEAVRSFALLDGRDLPLALHDPRPWQRCPADAAMIVSVDGAMVRSNKPDASGALQWFEARAGVISLNTPDAPKACVAGVMEPDRLFETLWSQSRQLQQERHKRKIVFVSDGANWIWDRVRQWFSGAVEVLDIYHAAEHVAGAAKAIWGEGHPNSKLWAQTALGRLQEKRGLRTLLAIFLEALRQGSLLDEAALKTELRYLVKNRHRMRYALLRAQGLPIGSGMMESVIKQTATRRLRQSGMMWTKPGAANMLRLRAAVVSGSLELTMQRQHQICRNRCNEYKKAV